MTSNRCERPCTGCPRQASATPSPRPTSRSPPATPPALTSCAASSGWPGSEPPRRVDDVDLDTWWADHRAERRVSAPPVHVSAMLGCEHGDDCGGVVDGVQHAVAASPCRPTPIEFASQWFPDAARCPQQVAGNELDRRRRYRLGQI